MDLLSYSIAISNLFTFPYAAHMDDNNNESSMFHRIFQQDLECVEISGGQGNYTGKSHDCSAPTGGVATASLPDKTHISHFQAFTSETNSAISQHISEEAFKALATPYQKNLSETAITLIKDYIHYVNARMIHHLRSGLEAAHPDLTREPTYKCSFGSQYLFQNETATISGEISSKQKRCPCEIYKMKKENPFLNEDIQTINHKIQTLRTSLSNEPSVKVAVICSGMDLGTFLASAGFMTFSQDWLLRMDNQGCSLGAYRDRKTIVPKIELLMTATDFTTLQNAFIDIVHYYQIYGESISWNHNIFGKLTCVVGPTIPTVVVGPTIRTVVVAPTTNPPVVKARNNSTNSSKECNII